MYRYSGQVIGSYWTDQDPWPMKIFVKTFDGVALLRFNSHRPVFFCLESEDLSSLSTYEEVRSIALKTIEDRPLKAVYFKEYAHQVEAARILAESGVRTYENDVRPHERFLMERFLNGQIEWVGQSEKTAKLAIFNAPKLAPITLSDRPMMSSLSLDIETNGADQLYSIGMSYYSNLHSSQGKHVVLMLDESSQRSRCTIEEHDYEVIFYPDIQQLLSAFVKHFNEFDPDFLVGWHVVGFDLAYLNRLAQKSGVELTIGRESSKLEISENGNISFAKLMGRQILDGPALLRFLNIRFSNMKLDTVASEVLGRNKDIELTGEEKVLEIRRRFAQDPISLAYYNIDDCRLVHDVFKKLKLYTQVLCQTELSGLSHDRLHYKSAHLDFSYLPRLHRKGYVAGNVLGFGEEEKLESVIARKPAAGSYKNIYRLSFQSLLAHLLVSIKLDPYAEKVSILPEVIKSLLEKRDLAASWSSMENSTVERQVDTLMNALMSSQSRYYRSDLAQELREMTSWFLKQCLSFFENQSMQTVYADNHELLVKCDEGALEFDQSVAALLFFLKRVAADELKLELMLPNYRVQFYERFLLFDSTNTTLAFLGLSQGKIDYQGLDYSGQRWCAYIESLLEKLKESFLYEQDIENFFKEEIDRLKAGEYDQLLGLRRRVVKELAEFTGNLPDHMKALAVASIRPGKMPGKMKGKWIDYVYTVQGPQLKEAITASIDYDYYIEKQIRPVATPLLEACGKSFDQCFSGGQLALF